MSKSLSRAGGVAAAVVAVALMSGCSGSESAPEPGSSESSAVAGSSSPVAVEEVGCSLPATEGTALESAPSSSWEQVGDMAVPTDPSVVGPGKVSDDGLRSCFAQSPVGALYANVNVWASSFNGLQEEVTRELMLDGPTRDETLESIEDGEGGGPESSGDAQIAGFNLVSYTPEEAVVELVMERPDGSLGALSSAMVWVDGDWKLDPESELAGAAREVTEDDFIAWTADDDSE